MPGEGSRQGADRSARPRARMVATAKQAASSRQRGAVKAAVAGGTQAAKVAVRARQASRSRSSAAAAAADAVSMVAAAKARPAAKRPPPPSDVETIEVRPSGTVVGRRPPPARRPPIIHLPVHPVVPRTPPSWMLAECDIAPARAGDQHEIIQLLSPLPAAPTRAEFHAAVDHPDHDSANRLVARIGGRLVGHAEVVPRQAFIGGVTVPAGTLDRVAVLPECRGAGHGQRLVRAAEERMRHFGATIAFSRTRIAASFHEMGWAVLGRDCATPGRPAEILARLLERAPSSAPRAAEGVSMRQWRHVELPAILRIYRQNAARFVGPLDRSEPYSRWLVSRGAFDSILVALVGQDRYDLHETTARIVGYCIQSGNRVLELLADPEFPGLERDILARVCAEAIENDRQQIIYESGSSDPLHRAVAGDENVVGVHDRMIVAKVLDPLRAIQAAAPATAERVAAAGIRETVELGIDAPSFRGSVIVADGKASVHPGRVGRSWMKLADDELARLLLGQCDPVEAVARGTMEPSTQMAQKLAGILFPRLPLWAPVWDDVPA